MTLRALRFIALSLFLAAGCSQSGLGTMDDGGAGDGSASDGGGGPPDLARPPLGDPIMGAPKNAWTWVDFPDSSCDDGSPTGVGINPGDGANLMVFLNGGGACWDYLTCYQINSAAHGPFGKAQFDAGVMGGLPGSVFDRADPKNPFKDYNFVFVPYCTGDVHGGDNVAMYEDNQGGMHPYHHKGHANVVAYLKRVAATWPSPPKVVVAGSSAGGYGTTLNYVTFRSYWPAVKMYLLDDSGPPLEEADIPQSYRDAWYLQWRLDKLVDPFCPMCRDNFALSIKYLGGAYPQDRMALLSSLQDRTIRTYMLLTAVGFQNAMLRLAMNFLDPTVNFRYFFVTGDSHTMLGKPASFTSQGTPLWDWLTQFINDDSAWKSTKP